MNLKTLPGILELRKLKYELAFRTHKNVNYFRGVYKNFDEAKKKAPRTKPLGYDHEDAAKMYRERCRQIFSTDYPVLYWMRRLQDRIRSVFDFGGHVGIHYYSYASYLDFNKFSTWTVCDVPSVLEEGERLKQMHSEAALNFCGDFQECEGHDLFLANGSLQYLEWNLAHQLAELENPPSFLILNMTPIHSDMETVTLQSIGAAYCPYLIRKESHFLKSLQDIGYRLVDDWENEEKQCKIPFHEERSVQKYRGFFLSRES